MNIKRITRISMIAALYIALSFITHPFSSGLIQFRISEFLVLLAFFNKDYIIAVTLGCFLYNLNPNSLGPLDWTLGTFHTFIAAVFTYKTKKLYLAWIWPAVFSPIIGLVLYMAIGEAFITSTLYVMLSLIVVGLISLGIFTVISKNSYLVELLKEEY